MIDGTRVPTRKGTTICENAPAPATRKDALQHALKPNPEAIFTAW